MMISTNEFRPGVAIEFRGGVWQVVEAMHVKPGKGSAFVQTKLKNLATGEVLRENFRAAERLPVATVEKLEMCYLYRDGQSFVMIDVTGAQSLDLREEHFRDGIAFLAEGTDGIVVWLHRGNVLRVELPNTVTLAVAETTPDQRGDTASGSSKLARLETGAAILVPFYIENGDVVRVDTRSGQYVGRVRIR